jgi:hypothetical protein
LALARSRRQRRQDELFHIGVDTTGWRLVDATGVSDDGLTITGWGFNPQGQREAFLAVIPEPASLPLLGIAGLAAMRRRRRGWTCSSLSSRRTPPLPPST